MYETSQVEGDSVSMVDGIFPIGAREEDSKVQTSEMEDRMRKKENCVGVKDRYKALDS